MQFNSLPTDRRALLSKRLEQAIGEFARHERVHKFLIGNLASSLRTADVFPVVASLPPKNNVCESERQNDFRDVEPF